MFMRRRPLLRAAVVGGGAYVAGKSVARRRGQQAQADTDQNQRIDDLEQQDPATSEQSAPVAAAAPSMTDQLNQLATLHQQGVLTDDEFSAGKAKLLGS
jgi:outer membrane murein-binding lipoprotein Lpp